MVHQGGIGTTAQALRAGVPQLVIPYSFDQPDNAARIERLGISQTIGRTEYSGLRAFKSLQGLLTNSKYSQQAKRIAQQVNSENGLQKSCDEIEEHFI